MHYFLDPDFNPVLGELNEEESRHAIKSLRLKIGDDISIGDGKGQKHICEVFEIGKKKIEVRVKQSLITEPKKRKLIIAIAPTKNISRFEWFLEKATEMGVDEIIPLQTKRTERPRLKMERAQRIVHAAAKQSLRPFIPILHELTDISELMQYEAASKLIAHCEENQARRKLMDAIQEMPSEGDCIILIGPEGDFTPEEISDAKAKKFSPIDLGEHRLRTETAGVFCAAVWLSK